MGHNIEYSRSLPITKPVFSVPLCYVIVTVLLNFEDDGGLEDDFGASVLQDHNVATLDPQAFAHGRRERDLTSVGNDEWMRHSNHSVTDIEHAS